MVNSASRSYRRVATGARFISFTVTVKETDLFIAIDKEAYYSSLPAEVERLVWRRRREIEVYIGRHLGFKTAKCLPTGGSPRTGLAMVRRQPAWADGGRPGSCGTSGTAASNFAGVIVENGGDIFLKLSNR